MQNIEQINNKLLDSMFLDAILDGNINKIYDLIVNGVNLNAVDDKGQTALHWMAYKGNLEIFSILIKLGADINLKDKFQRTILHCAVTHKNMNVGDAHSEIITTLINAGIDIHAKDKWQQSALHLAAIDGHADIVLLLLHSGAKIDIFTDIKSPIELATEHNHPDIVKILKQFKQMQLLKELSKSNENEICIINVPRQRFRSI